MVKNLAIKCRGLPFSCTEEDLRKFLGDSGIESVDLPIRDGKAVGEATITYNNDRDYNEALKKDHEYMGHRWIEVFPADQDGSKKPRFREHRERDRGGYDRGMDRGGHDRGRAYGGPEEKFGRFGEACIRIRGLPYSAKESDVFEFFRGLPILQEGVLLAEDPKSVNGEAFIVFDDERGARSAKALHMKTMGRRYIEIFDASYTEMVRFCQDNRLRIPRPPPGGGGGGGGPAFDSYSSYPRNNYPDRPPQAPFDNNNPYPSDPYYGSSGYGGRESRQDPYPSRDSYAPRDDYRQGGGDPYGRNDPRPDPFGREDPFARRGYDDAYGRSSGYPSAPPADPYTRPNESRVWHDDRAPPPAAPSASYAPSTGAGGMDNYGYGDYSQQGAGGGPMKREAPAPAAWRAPEYERPQIEAPRGRERPGQRYVLKMRGVPFRAVETDVYEFFEPIRPSRVEIVREPGGRPSGEARVEFDSRKDYDEALLKDKQYMGSRYVELFPDFGGARF